MLVLCLIVLICGSAYGANAGNDETKNLETGFTDLTVSLSVVGNLADNSQLFNFKIYFKDIDGNVITDTAVKYTGGVLIDANALPPADASVDLEFPDGIGVFDLKHGQTATFEDIPSDWMMCVSMVRDAMYMPKFTDSGGAPGQLGVNSTGERPLRSNSRLVAFTNDRLDIILTGIADIEWSNSAFTFMAAAIALMCLTPVCIKLIMSRLR
jgi:hypothetical protein